MSLKINVHFASGTGNHRVLRKGKLPQHSKSKRLPRVTRLMALSIKYEYLLNEGLVGSHKELAALAGVERSQISTIVRFRQLAPCIQEWLLNLPESDSGRNPVSMIELRSISAIPCWDKQCRELRKLAPDHFLTPAQTETACPSQRLNEQGPT